MRRHLTPGVQRMLDRLDDVPVMVLGAAWELMTGNALAFVLLGDPSARRGHDRNIIWRHFTGVPSRFVRTEAENAALELKMVADRHVARGRYPDDPSLRSLVDERMH